MRDLPSFVKDRAQAKASFEGTSQPDSMGRIGLAALQPTASPWREAARWDWRREAPDWGPLFAKKKGRGQLPSLPVERRMAEIKAGRRGLPVVETLLGGREGG